MQNDQVLVEAEFNRNVRTYWLLSGAIMLTFTGIGILFLPFWFGFGNYFTEQYLKRMKCSLTERSLKMSKGVFVRVEKTIPLDKITDLAVVQGPIMRYLNIESLSVETAGQSSPGALVSLTGILDGRQFRDAVLQQRDIIVASGGTVSASESVAVVPVSPPGSDDTLTEIRDTLLRIEKQLSKRESR